MLFTGVSKLNDYEEAKHGKFIFCLVDHFSSVYIDYKLSNAHTQTLIIDSNSIRGAYIANLLSGLIIKTMDTLWQIDTVKYLLVSIFNNWSDIF